MERGKELENGKVRTYDMSRKNIETEYLYWPTMKRIKHMAIDLDIASYRKYLNSWYEQSPQYSDRTILSILHQWRLAIYLNDRLISKEMYIESINWLSKYYEDENE